MVELRKQVAGEGRVYWWSPRRKEIEMSGRFDRARQPVGVWWTQADLDRCEHGRHSIDSCFDCPGGMSSGNAFLMSLTPWTRTVDGIRQVRIGTMVRGEPIWVEPTRKRVGE